MATTFVHYNPAQYVTAKAQAAVTAGTFVQIAADLDGRNPVVKPAAAGTRPFGVAAGDTKQGDAVMVYRRGHILDVAADGAIAAGDAVEVGANGKAKKSAGSNPVVGEALAAAKNDTVTIAFE